MTAQVRELEAFLLSVEWRDGARGIELPLWGASTEGPVRASVTGQEAVMFVPRTWPAQAGRREARPLRTRDGRDVDGYASAPPHVKVARLLAEAETEATAPTEEVEYVMTTRGPEPLALRSAPIDYRHYLDKQLAPAVDVALGLLGTSFDQVAGAQLRLL